MLQSKIKKHLRLTRNHNERGAIGFHNLLLIFVVTFSIVGVYRLVASRAGEDPHDRVGQAQLKEDPKRGVVYRGLKLIKKTAKHPCKGMFMLEGVTEKNGKPMCTHGPDPAPEGIDVTKPVDLKALHDKLEKTPTASKEYLTSMDVEKAPAAITQSNAATYSTTALSDVVPKSPIQCYGDGKTGKRVKLIFMYPDVAGYSQDDINRSVQIVKNIAGMLESQMIISSTNPRVATSNNPTIRHIRFVHSNTSTGCSPLVSVVKTPMRSQCTVDDDCYIDFRTAVSLLQEKGYNDDDRKYLIFSGKNKILSDYTRGYCGVANHRYDDSPSPRINDNNNSEPMYAAVSAGCWHTNTALHELVHTLGAVNQSAPRSADDGHCRDNYDVMCYDGWSAVSGCLNSNFEFYMDCNDNDYFASGTVRSSNYLYNHWNTANSSYLSR